MKKSVRILLVIASILISNFGVKKVFASNKRKIGENIELEKKVRSKLIAKIESFKMDNYSYTEEYESYYENFKISKEEGMLAASKLKEIIPALSYENITEFHQKLELKLLNHNFGLIPISENTFMMYYLICPINIVNSYVASVKEFEDEVLSSEINKNVFGIIHDLEPNLGSFNKVRESANKEEKAAGRWIKLTSSMAKKEYENVMILFKKISEKLYFLAYEKRIMFKNCAQLDKRYSNLQNSIYKMNMDQTNLLRYKTESDLEIEDPEGGIANGLNRKTYEAIIDLSDCNNEIHTICKSADNEDIIQCLHQKITFVNVKCLSTINSIREYEMMIYEKYGHKTFLTESERWRGWSQGFQGGYGYLLMDGSQSVE